MHKQKKSEIKNLRGKISTLPNGQFNDNICSNLTNLMSKMKYIIPFLSSHPFIIPLVLPRKNLMGFSLPYLGLLTCPTAILMIIYARF